MPRTEQSLLEIATAVNSATDLDEIVRVVMDRVRELIAFDRSMIALLDPGTGMLEMHELGAGDRRDPLCDPGRKVPAEPDNAVGWVVVNQRPDLRRSLAENTGFRSVQRGEEVPSHVLVPLAGREDVFGVLGIGSFSDDAFSEDDVALFQAFARLVGVAIENLRNFERARDLGLRDPLTGAFNRRYFDTVVGQELSRMERYGSGFALLLVDVDHFKAFNDRYGHPAGDRLLIQTVGILQEHLRQSDALCRIGGDEFAVLLPSTDSAAACTVGGNILRTLREKNHVRPDAKTSQMVSVSIGYAVAPDHATQADELFHCADEALYYAKDSGRNVCVACPRPAASARKA